MSIAWQQIVAKPVVTEKATRLKEEGNRFVFEVAAGANKHEIKRAVEQLFSVGVLDVRTLSMHGKPKRLGRFVGRRPNRKRAIVTLRAGDTIDLFEGA